MRRSAEVRDRAADGRERSRRRRRPSATSRCRRACPTASTGPAAIAARHVINDWLKALRRGNVKRAAHYFALPSKFQNATPVLTVHNEQERIAVNVSLSCGAVATEMGGAGVVHDRHLPAHRAQGRQLRHGRRAARRAAPSASSAGTIKEWYRLPDEPGGAQQAPPAPSGPSV